VCLFFYRFFFNSALNDIDAICESILLSLLKITLLISPKWTIFERLKLQGYPKNNVGKFNSSQWGFWKRPNGLKSYLSAIVIAFSK